MKAILSRAPRPLIEAAPANFPAFDADAGEAGRLDALRRLLIVDTAPETVWDDLVALASEICQTPMAAVSLVDHDRQWHKARIGLDACELPRDVSFCSHAIADPDRLLVVDDARSDARFADNPLVTGAPHVRFYAGAPIVTADGHALGTVCVIDSQARTLGAAQRRCLEALARQAGQLIDARQKVLAAAELSRAEAGQTAEARLLGERGVELLELVLQGRAMGLWELDVARDRWVASSHELAMLGYGKDGADEPDADWTRLVHPDDLALTRESMGPHLRGEVGFYECTIRMRHRLGHWIWVLSRAVVVERTAVGVPLRIVGTHVDVTEQRRLETERRQNAERIELAMAGGDLGLWDIDLPSGKVIYNAQWADMLGYTLAEVEAAPDFWKTVLRPDEGDAFLEALRLHLADAAPYLEIEGRMRHKLGHAVWVLTRAKVVSRDAAGKPMRILGINLNVSALKASEFARQHEVARRKALLAQATEFVFVLDRDHRLAEANASFAAVLGYAPREVTSLRPWHWDASTPDREAFERRCCEQAASAWTAETRWIRKDGSLIDVAMSCTSVTFDGREERLFVCHDITDSKRTRLALEQTRHLLEETGRLARVGGWEFDLRTSRITWSDEVYRIHEVDRSWVPDLAGAVAFYAPEGRPVVEAAVAAAVADGTAWDLELPLITAGGRRIWVRAIGRAMREAGETIRLVGSFQDITERRAAREALRHSEQRLTLALESSKQSIFEWDVLSGTIHLGAQMAVARGGPPAALDLSVPAFLELVHPDDRERLRATLAGVVEGLGSAYEHEHRIAHLDRGWVWIRSVGRVSQRNAHGMATRLSAVDRDITSRKVAELALVASERRLRMITDNMPALILYIDAQQRYTFVNAHFARVFGIEPATILGRTMREVVGERVYADIAPQVQSALRGEAVQFEAIGPARGRPLHYQSHYVPDIGPDGVVAGFHALILDVTDRKQAELKSAENAQRLRGIADNVPALISEVDRDGRFTFVNGTYREWLGLDPEAMVGQLVTEGVSDTILASRQEEIARALRGERLSFERQVDLITGSRTLHSTYLPHFDADQRVAGFYAFTNDITEQKQTQVRLDALARADTLTALPNRRHFEEHAIEAFARARRTGQIGACLYLDVDRFKSINDALGHGVGDEVLLEFARRLSGCLRETDFVARYAGDEFVAIAEGVVSVEAALRLAGKFVAATRTPFTLPSMCLDVTTSIGVAVFDGHETLTALLGRADGALYKAKQNGRDGCALADEAETSDASLTLVDAKREGSLR